MDTLRATGLKTKRGVVPSRIDYFKGAITAQTEKLDKLLGHEPVA